MSRTDADRPGDAGEGRLFVPVLTPFRTDLSPDSGRLADHCRWLLSQGAGLAPFGTTSEGNSLNVAEKIGLLEALARADVDLRRAMPGTGCCALGDTVDLTRRALQFGCLGVLMLPPFYYKNVSDDGLYGWYDEVIQRVADPCLRIYLYHIPPVAGVGISAALAQRLVKTYPAIVAGMKDSGGVWEHTHAVLDALAGTDFQLFCGSEQILLKTLRHGGAGCISAIANVNAAAILALCRGWRNDDAEQNQDRLNAVRAAFEKYPVIAALKAALAHFRDDGAWRTVRPPLVPLPAAEANALVDDLKRLGFALPAGR